MRSLPLQPLIAAALLVCLGAGTAVEAEVSITAQKAAELFAALPADDPWEKTQDASALAWGESHTLMALMNLYEGTGDVRYLADVARRGERLLEHRDDRRGVADGSGKTRPAWSMGRQYVVAQGKLVDPAGKPAIKLRSTPTSNNHLTTVEVKPGPDGRFDLLVANPHYTREELFPDLSLKPHDERFIAKILNHSTAPLSPRPGQGEGHSQLLRVEKVEPDATAPGAQSITLQPIPLAFAGYVGVIYHPMMRFAETVKADPALAELVPAADRFVAAAEETFADVSSRLWRDGPKDGEGYYLSCERGESFPFDNIGLPFNYLGRHAATEIALHRLTGKPEYLRRARAIATLFKNRLRHDEANDLYLWNYWYEPVTLGWKPQDKLSYNIPHMEPSIRPEDTSHAVLDLDMVAACHDGGVVFDDADMRRFANTLLRNVLLPDGVRRDVTGAGEKHDPYFRAAHGWMVLASVNPEVYHAMRKTYTARGDDELRWLAALLKWERKLGPAPESGKPLN